MKLTSTFILTALVALRATGVSALPFTYTDAALDARNVAPSYDDILDARSYANKFHNEQTAMYREGAQIRAQEHRLHQQHRDVSLQEQIHKDHRALRTGNAFGPREFDELEARSRFGYKVGQEESTMHREVAHIKAQERQLHAQHRDVSLQQNIHKDRQALRSQNAFVRRMYDDLEARSRFGNQVTGEDATMNREAAGIKAKEHRLHQQRKDVSLQEQIHKDRHALHGNNAFGPRELDSEVLETL